MTLSSLMTRTAAATATIAALSLPLIGTSALAADVNVQNAPPATPYAAVSSLLTSSPA